jgi:hypothetical protein
MSLWVDGLFVQSADLILLDPEVGDVASASSITVDGPSGLCAETISECLSEIMAKMQRFGGYLSSGMLSANHLAAVFNVGGPGVNRTKITPSQIVVRQQNIPQVDAVRRWVAYRCLYNFFRAAANRTQDERFEGKARAYWTDAKRRFLPLLRSNGLPVVYRPMPCPGATLDRNAGNWTSSNVTTVSRMGTTGGEFDVAITWVDQSQYNGPQYGGQLNKKGNAESYTSAVQTTTVTAGEALSVSIAGLNPPNLYQDPAYANLCLVTDLNATGYNVYVGLTGQTLYLQNASPIPVATTSYALPADPVLSGYASDWGQYMDSLYTFNQDVLQRG